MLVPVVVIVMVVIMIVVVLMHRVALLLQRLEPVLVDVGLDMVAGGPRIAAPKSPCLKRTL